MMSRKIVSDAKQRFSSRVDDYINYRPILAEPDKAVPRK